MTILCTVLLGLTGGAAAPVKERAPVVWPAADVPWADAAPVKGAKVAVLWGDPKSEANGTFKKFAPGTVIPPHTHTHDQRTVVIAGTLALKVGDAAPKDLGAGSFALVPGGLVHTATCGRDAECLVYEEQPGPSDFIPAR